MTLFTTPMRHRIWGRAAAASHLGRSQPTLFEIPSLRRFRWFRGLGELPEVVSSGFEIVGLWSSLGPRIGSCCGILARAFKPNRGTDCRQVRPAAQMRRRKVCRRGRGREGEGGSSRGKRRSFEAGVNTKGVYSRMLPRQA